MRREVVTCLRLAFRGRWLLAQVGPLPSSLGRAPMPGAKPSSPALLYHVQTRNFRLQVLEQKPMG